MSYRAKIWQIRIESSIHIDFLVQPCKYIDFDTLKFFSFTLHIHAFFWDSTQVMTALTDCFIIFHFYVEILIVNLRFLLYYIDIDR